MQGREKMGGGGALNSMYNIKITLKICIKRMQNTLLYVLNEGQRTTTQTHTYTLL